jgi:polyhydroxyalkanoate synthesis regulator phasin
MLERRIEDLESEVEEMGVLRERAANLERRVGKLEAEAGEVEALRARLAELGELVERLQARLQELAGEPPGPKWHRSGSIHPELDDQMIAP